MPAHILLLDDDPQTRESVIAALGPTRPCLCASGTVEAERLLDAGNIKVLICSDDLAEEPGLMFLTRTKDRWPHLRRILLAPNLDGDLFFHAMREVSLFDYLTKPVVPSELTAAVVRAIAQHDAARRTGGKPQAAVAPEFDAAEDGAPETPKRRLPHDGALFIGGFISGCVATIVLLGILYMMKTHAGYDFFPLLHLHELME